MNIGTVNHRILFCHFSAEDAVMSPTFHGSMGFKKVNKSFTKYSSISVLHYMISFYAISHTANMTKEMGK